MVKTPVLIALAALSAAVPAAASAAPTVSVDPTTNAVTYLGGGADNFVTANRVVGLPVRYAFDTTPLTPGAGCTQTAPTIVQCATVEQSDMVLRGGNGNDRLSARELTGLTAVYGGPGDDKLFSGGGKADAVGGTGNDVVFTSPNAPGTVISGNGGDDLMLVLENSGIAGGGDGNDVLMRGGHTANATNGGRGDDTLIGLKPNGQYNGGEGDDIVAFTPPGSTISYSGAVINGGDGADRLYGSVLNDTVKGGPGSDVVSTYGDGLVDTVDCGGGVDTAYVDAIDVVTRCENVVVGAAPADQQVSDAIAKAQADSVKSLDDLQPLPSAS